MRSRRWSCLIRYNISPLLMRTMRFDVTGELVLHELDGIPQIRVPRIAAIDPPWRRKACTILPTVIKDDRLNVAKIADKTVWPEPPRYPVEATGYTVKASHYSQLLARIREHCEANAIATPSEPEIEQWLCDNLALKCKNEDGSAYANQYEDRRNWPLLLRPMRLLAKDGDRGLGDIVSRTIPKGDEFKKWHKKYIGYDCGCDSRINWLNVQFPI